MAKSNFAINAVGGGEVSPKFYGRFDTNPYPQGCEEVTNCIVFPQGGAGTRPGTMIVNQITQAVYPAGAVIGVTSVAGQLIPGDAFTDTRVFPFLAADGTRIQIVAKNRCPFFFEWIGTANGASAWYGLDIESGFQYQVKCDPDELFMNYQSGANAATEYDMDAQGINLQEVQYVQTGNRIYFIHKKMRTFYLQFNQVPSVPVAYFSMGFLIGLRASDAFSDSQKLVQGFVSKSGSAASVTYGYDEIQSVHDYHVISDVRRVFAGNHFHYCGINVFSAPRGMGRQIFTFLECLHDGDVHYYFRERRRADHGRAVHRRSASHGYGKLR
jgi:hypothetical protein